MRSLCRVVETLQRVGRLLGLLRATELLRGTVPAIFGHMPELEAKNISVRKGIIYGSVRSLESH